MTRGVLTVNSRRYSDPTGSERQSKRWFIAERRTFAHFGVKRRELSGVYGDSDWQGGFVGQAYAPRGPTNGVLVAALSM